MAHYGATEITERLATTHRYVCMITKPFNKDLKEKAYKDSLLLLIIQHITVMFP